MKKLKVLMLEDSQLDAELIKEELAEHKFDFTSKLVETEKDFRTAIQDFRPGLILSDYKLPEFTGFEALEIAKKLVPDIPFIIVTGSLSEEMAADSIKKGAWDYVLKENLTRLTTAIENALKLKVEKDKSRQTEEALRESEERFRSYVDYAPHGVFVADKNGNYLDANSAASKITGYSKEELLMMNLIDLTAPESLEITGDHFNKTVNEGFASGEIAFIRKDGSKGFWTVDTVKLSKDRFLGFVVDVTERRQAEEAIKESEEKLRNIFENSTNLFYSHTPDNLITYTSPQVKNILGYTQEEAMIKWTELTSDNPRNEIGLKHTARTIETGKQQPTYELELVKKSGEKVWVEVREAPVVKDGKTVSIVGALTDITERKQKERELIAKIKQLEMFNEITVDREIEINETRKEVNELLKQMGKAPKYIVVE